MNDLEKLISIRKFPEEQNQCLIDKNELLNRIRERFYMHNMKAKEDEIARTVIIECMDSVFASQEIKKVETYISTNETNIIGICLNCNGRIDNDSIFCKYCGAKIIGILDTPSEGIFYKKVEW